jgi:hypothetical protein
MAGIRLDSRKSVQSFKDIICLDISEFESCHPSHAVGSLWRASIPCRRLAPDADSLHAPALRRLIQPPIAEEEIAAKEKDIKRLRVRLGLTGLSQSGNGASPNSFCQPACRDCSILDAFCHAARASLPLTLPVC